MLRQVFVYDPDLKCSVHRYEDLGPGAAKPNHGGLPSTHRHAATMGKFRAPKIPQLKRADEQEQA